MTAPPPHLLRAYEPGDERMLLTLLHATLGERAASPKSERFWSWKHLENPFGRSYGVYAWDEQAQRALALRMLMRWRFTDGAGGSLDAVRAVDTATAADCRRTGLFTALTTRAVDHLARGATRFIFNTPNVASLPGYLKMGWQVVAAWPMYVRVRRPLRFLAALDPRRQRAPAVLPAWDSFFGGGALRWGDLRNRFGDDVGRLAAAWELKRPRRPLRTQRSIAYLDWRYGGHPGVSYAAVPALSAGRLAGLAVLRPNIRLGLREAVLTEIVLRETDPVLARELLKAVDRAVRADYLVGHFAAGSFELASLRRARYFKAPGRGKVFTVRRLGASGADGTDAADPGAWDLSAGDLEVF